MANVKAQDLEHAWKNFAAFPLSKGAEDPFYIGRDDKPLKNLIRNLVFSDKLPKCFFTGFRGCGKSTELVKLSRDESILEKYYIVQFSIRNIGDLYNLDYTDLLLGMGAKIFTQFIQDGKTLDSELLDELESWKTTTVEKLTNEGVNFQAGAGLDLEKFFISVLAKTTTEFETRINVRKVIQPQLKELIDTIDKICLGIQVKEKKAVLVIIDDLDKVNLEDGRRLFYDHLNTLMAPNCAIVYTLPAAILFEDVFAMGVLNNNYFFLPNIGLHKKKSTEKNQEGYTFFKNIFSSRAEEGLITDEALEQLTYFSGGVLSEFIFGVKSAIDNALNDGREQVTMDDIGWAKSQIRNTLLRLISDNDIDTLNQIHKENPERLPSPKDDSRLIHIRAVLEYTNGISWFDIHPAIQDLCQ